jgi:zinc protease
VKVGNHHEDTSHVEFAHLLEHLAFRGSRQFPDAWAFVDSAGLVSGRDVNGFTTTYSTTYVIGIPSYNKELLRKSMLLLRSFIADLLLSQEKIDVERLVVMEEIRRTMGYGQIANERYQSQIYSNSICRTKTVEQRMRSLMSINRDSLVNFYKRWYVPENIALIAVGDIDVYDMRERIAEVFGSLSPCKKGGRSQFTMKCYDDASAFVAIKDSQISDVQIHLYKKKPSFLVRTYADMRNVLVMEVYAALMNGRFSDLNNRYDLPFQFVTHAVSRHDMNVRDAMYVQIITRPERIEESYKLIETEFERAIRYGFEEKELASVKEALGHEKLSFLGSSSAQYAASCNSNFVRGESLVDPALKSSVELSLLQGVNLDDIHQLVRDWLLTEPDILLFLPDNDRVVVPTYDTFKQWRKDVKMLTVSPFQARSLQTVQLPIKDGTTSHTYGSCNTYDNGVLEFLLNNGVKIVLKPVLNSDSQVRIHAMRLNGASMYNAGEDYYSALCAAEIVHNTGIARYDKFAMRNFLLEQGLEVHPYISRDQAGIIASSKANGVESLVQLLYGYFFYPYKDEIAFIDWFNRKRLISLANNVDPKQWFYRTVDSLMLKSNTQGSDLSVEEVELVDLDKAYNSYCELFSDISEYTFVVVGSFNPDEMIALLAKYFGDTSGAEKLQHRSNDVSPKLAMHKSFNRVGTGEKAVARLYYAGDYRYGPNENSLLDALSKVLEIRLTERLRNKEGGTYAVDVQAQYDVLGRYYLQIDFECSKQNVGRLVSCVRKEILSLKKKGPGISITQSVRGERCRAINASSLTTTQWEGLIIDKLSNGDPLSCLDEAEGWCNCKHVSLKRAARKFLKEDRLFVFSLVLEQH